VSFPGVILASSGAVPLSFASTAREQAITVAVFSSTIVEKLGHFKFFVKKNENEFKIQFRFNVVFSFFPIEIFMRL
jgi:hypothetical protein